MPSVTLVQLTKRYGTVFAVRRVSLEVREGEFVTLLGPSGCGKTTTLRCVAGFVQPDEGDVRVDGRSVLPLPPERRGMGLVFQNYALWPHMTVRENVAFGLRLRRLSSGDIARRVRRALELVRLSGLEDRYPRQLSGGQQQRVALARALAIEPSVLLLDEPLSNLDALLREEMRFELRELQRRLGITTIYVTHDQAEALVLSDRITLLRDGSLAQVGTPQEIYSRPADRFVAGFVGTASFLEGVIAEPLPDGSGCRVRTQDGFTIAVRGAPGPAGQKVTVVVRPEHVERVNGEPSPPTGETGRQDASSSNLFRVRVLQTAYVGNALECRLQLGSAILRARFPTHSPVAAGQEVMVRLASDKVVVLPE